MGGCVIVLYIRFVLKRTNLSNKSQKVCFISVQKQTFLYKSTRCIFQKSTIISFPNPAQNISLPEVHFLYKIPVVDFAFQRLLVKPRDCRRNKSRVLNSYCLKPFLCLLPPRGHIIWCSFGFTFVSSCVLYKRPIILKCFFL